MKTEAEGQRCRRQGQRKEIEKLNNADSLIFQTEKALKEYGDKIPAEKKAPIEAALNKLKEAHKSGDLSAIDAASAELNTVFQAASQEMYNAGAGQAQQGPQGPQAGPQGGASSNSGSSSSSTTGNGDNVTDVDYEEVK